MITEISDDYLALDAPASAIDIIDTLAELFPRNWASKSADVLLVAAQLLARNQQI